jgi:hypothetical protein
MLIFFADITNTHHDSFMTFLTNFLTRAKFKTSDLEPVGCNQLKFSENLHQDLSHFILSTTVHIQICIVNFLYYIFLL